jgi:hypothetical protein
MFVSHRVRSAGATATATATVKKEKNMSGERAKKEVQVSVGQDLSTAVIRGGKVEVSPDNNVVVKPARTNDSAATKATPKVGNKMEDGTVEAGISPDTGKAMYVTPADAPLAYTFNQAMEYAAKLDAHGHQDWRVPTKGELNVLFQNRAAIGGFNETGLWSGGWYGSLSGYLFNGAWAQRFSDGTQLGYDKDRGSSLRCVR